MKIQKVQKDIQSSGIQETSSFGIEVNSTAFDILSSKLYTDKIMAVIRELSCNAYDAHVMKYGENFSKQFEVHIPTMLEPFFEVKDFGIGLRFDDEVDEVANLYTTYFKSTKRDSNEAIGGFGVGSKSPFAYTNGFTVKARWKGKERTYDAYLSNGSPTISKLSEVSTIEEDGVTISFAVKNADITHFQEKANEFFSFWKTLPNIKGLSKKISYYKELYPLNKGEEEVEGFHYASDNSRFNRYNRAYVIMGNVPYDVSSTILSNDGLEGYFFSSVQLFLEVPIGTFNPAASREYLSFEDKGLKTEDALKDIFVSKMEEFFNKKATKLKKEFEDLNKKKTVWHRKIAQNSFKSGSKDSAFLKYVKKFDYDLYDVISDNYNMAYIRMGDKKYPDLSDFDKESILATIPMYSCSKDVSGNISRLSFAKVYTLRVTSKDEYVVFINDLGNNNRTNMRIRQWLNTTDVPGLSAKTILYFKENKHYETFKNVLGCSNEDFEYVVYLSDIEIAKVTKSIIKKEKKLKTINGTFADVSKFNTVFYVETYYDDIVIKDGDGTSNPETLNKYTYEEFKRILHRYVYRGNTDFEFRNIVLIPKSEMRKGILDNPSWVNVNVDLVKFMENFYKDDERLQFMSDIELCRTLSRNYSNLSRLRNYLKDLPNFKRLYLFIDDYLEKRKELNKFISRDKIVYDLYEGLYRYYNCFWNRSNYTQSTDKLRYLDLEIKIKEEFIEVCEVYPLFEQVITSFSGKNHLTDFLGYVKVIQEKEKKYL